MITSGNLKGMGGMTDLIMNMFMHPEADLTDDRVEIAEAVLELEAA